MTNHHHPYLLAMPAEIQLAICAELLGSHENTSATPAQPDPTDLAWGTTLENLPALGNLARTCKHFRHFTMAMLYKRVKVSIYRPVAFGQLIRHFSRFGDRATLVKELSIDSGRDTSSLSASQVDFLLQEGQRLRLTLLPSCVDVHVPGKIESVLIDVLLCQVPAIRKLVISLQRSLEPALPLEFTEFTAKSDGPSIWELMSNNQDHESRVVSYATWLSNDFTLGSLRHVESHAPTSGSNLEGGLNKGSLTALLRHAPAVTHLRVGYCEDRRFLSVIQGPLPELRDVQLWQGKSIDLIALATFCPRLQRCRIGADHRVLSKTAEMIQKALQFHMFPPEIGVAYSTMADKNLKALLPLRFALRDLDMDFHTFFVPEVECLRRLSCFAALRSLRCVPGTWPSGDSTMLIDKLPPGIESLCLGGHGIPVYDIAVLLHERVSDGRLPNLKSFRYTLVDEELEPEMAESIVKVFEGTDVDCAEKLNFPVTGVLTVWETNST